MTISELSFLVFIVSAFAFFGGLLGWAGWQEGRDTKLKAAMNGRGRA